MLVVIRCYCILGDIVMLYGRNITVVRANTALSMLYIIHVATGEQVKRCN